jgi:hypothetical protein
MTEGGSKAPLVIAYHRLIGVPGDDDLVTFPVPLKAIHKGTTDGAEDSDVSGVLFHDSLTD